MTARFALVLVALSLVAQALGQPPNSSEEEDFSVKAELSARQLLENPKNEDAWAALVRAQIGEDDLKRAEETLHHWRAKVPSPNAASDRIEGELAWQAADPPRAMRAWKRYLQKVPKDDAAWRLLASACAKQQDWKDGVDAMGHALTLRPDAAGFVQRAKLRLRLRDWAGANSDINEANRLEATDAGVQALFPLFERSTTWLPRMIALDRRVEKQPNDSSSLLDRAEWLRQIGFLDVARDDFAAALRLNPKSLRARLWSGLVAQEQLARIRDDGKDSDQRESWEKQASAVSVMPVDSTLITPDFQRELKVMDAATDAEARAQFLVKYRQPLLALREVQGVEGSPALALALLDLDRLPQAGRAARQATELHPKSAPAWLALARWNLETGNYQEALDAVKRSAKAQRTPEAEELRKLAQQRLGKR